MSARKSASKAPEESAPAPGSQSAHSGRRKSGGPSTDEIAAAAYLNYRRRIDEGLPGNHEEDWLKAERDLGGDRT